MFKDFKEFKQFMIFCHTHYEVNDVWHFENGDKDILFEGAWNNSGGNQKYSPFNLPEEQQPQHAKRISLDEVYEMWKKVRANLINIHWVNQPDYIGNTIEMINDKFIMTDKNGFKTENIDMRHPHMCKVHCAMRKKDYLKCIVSVINFLMLSDDEVIEEKQFNTESNKSMTKVLKNYGYDMISFTKHLSSDPLWIDSPKEFFSDDEKCLSFFISKLNEYNTKN